MTNKLLLEGLYGLGSDNIDITNDTVDQNVARDDQDRELAKSRDFNDNVQTPSNKTVLNARQSEIYNVIRNNPFDAFVSYPPSAGKTMPVIQAIMELFQARILNSNNTTPHILYIVPRKQLAAQIADNDFRSAFIDLISGKKYVIPGFDPIVIFSFAYRRNNGQLYYDKNIGDNYAYRLVSEMTGGNEDPVNINTNGISYDNFVPVIVATYEKAETIISKYGNKITRVVIDEVQELVSHPGEGINEGLEKRYKSLVSILKLTSKKTGIVLMTGSINQNSVKFLSDYFTKTYGRNFRVIPTYTPQIAPYKYGDNSQAAKDTEGQLLNRSQISLKTMKSLSGYPNVSVPAKLNLIKNIVVNKQSESVMIIFSNRTNKQGIFGMLEALIKMLPPYPTNYFTQEATSHVTNVINGSEKATLDDRKNIEFLKYFDLNEVLRRKDTKDDSDIKTGTTLDDQNILYQAVLRGVAPLIGPMNQLHKKIIQYYFSEKKKIHLVLGTDALGIGANVKCRYLYLPTIYKFDGKKLARSDESSLVQLIHRAGRGSFPTASIYCSVEDYDYIYNLLNNDPRGGSYTDDQGNEVTLNGVPELNTSTLEDLEKIYSDHGEKGLIAIFKSLFK